jgi:hypothetical protein
LYLPGDQVVEGAELLKLVATLGEELMKKSGVAV